MLDNSEFESYVSVSDQYMDDRSKVPVLPVSINNRYDSGTIYDYNDSCLDIDGSVEIINKPFEFVDDDDDSFRKDVIGPYVSKCPKTCVGCKSCCMKCIPVFESVDFGHMIYGDEYKKGSGYSEITYSCGYFDRELSTEWRGNGDIIYRIIYRLPECIKKFS